MTDDFFQSRLDAMIDLRHPLAVLATRMPRSQLEASFAPLFVHRERAGSATEAIDLFGAAPKLAGAGGRSATAVELTDGRPVVP
ncbi:hypothetical protein [Burkholderia ubonensis]|uniref:hypothetical protein n=1 Tax=Burkholderia ubonensis TaxID=101571 RepID=UPI00075D247F|nr:hypothetical protein WK99_12605 [Burkholderia ubonensis]